MWESYMLAALMIYDEFFMSCPVVCIVCVCAVWYHAVGGMARVTHPNLIRYGGLAHTGSGRQKE